MQEKLLGLRLKKTVAIQARLLELLDKEVKTPLTATGSFFDLVEEESEFASRAKRQLDQTLTVLDTLLEWGIVHQLDRNREWAETDTHRMMRGLFARFKQGACGASRRFSLIDRHKGGGVSLLPEAEIRFILEMILHWLCEVAEEGEILVERLMVERGILRVEVRLRSGSLFSRLGHRVERLVNGRVSSEDKRCPVEGFYLALARDIVEEFHGDLWVQMRESVIEAGFTLDLTDK